MKKRFLCTFLLMMLLLSVVYVSAVEADAASTMTASDSCINLIKSLEGFVSTPVWDYGQYSVGYGSACNQGDYPNGITEAEADALLRAEVASVESKLNSFAEKNGLTFSQQRFDALVSFTYNVGSSWMSDTEGMFRSAVVNGSIGNDFIFAMGRWSSVTLDGNKTVSIGLVNRRLSEANLYLNGVYSKDPPAHYTYVVFDNNIDECTNNVRVQAYDSSIGDGVRAVPGKTGYRFLGWYTAADGGRPITVLNDSTAELTLYGHWQQGDGSVDAEGNVVGLPASYKLQASASGTQAVRQQPSTDAAVVKTLGANEEIVVVADYMDSSGIKWGQLSGGGWISVAEASDNSGNSAESGALAEPMVITVTTNGVNIRSGPGTSYAKVGTASKGQQITITAVKQGGQYLWGKFSGGWICLDYTDYETVLAESSGAVVTATGIVTADRLNVRSGPGTNYSLIGYLYEGDQVTITAQKQVGSTTWGLTEYGWVSLYYVNVTPVEQKPDEPADTPDGITPMYRLYNPYSGEHFYTGSTVERDSLITAGWQYEGVAWNAPVKDGEPVHRLYNPNSGDHHYTMSAEERDDLVAVGWQYEGVCWNSASADDLPLYRLYNPNADCGSHHYTGSEEERDNLVAVGWVYEGIGWFGLLK